METETYTDEQRAFNNATNLASLITGYSLIIRRAIARGDTYAISPNLGRLESAQERLLAWAQSQNAGIECGTLRDIGELCLKVRKELATGHENLMALDGWAMRIKYHNDDICHWLRGLAVKAAEVEA